MHKLIYYKNKIYQLNFYRRVREVLANLFSAYVLVFCYILSKNVKLPRLINYVNFTLCDYISFINTIIIIYSEIKVDYKNARDVEMVKHALMYETDPRRNYSSFEFIVDQNSLIIRMKLKNIRQIRNESISLLETLSTINYTIDEFGDERHMHQEYNYYS